MNRPFVIIGIVVIVLVILAFWVFPMYQDFQELSVELIEKDAELQNREDYFSEIQSINDRLKIYEEELAKLHAAIPNDSSLPSLYDLVQRLSSESGLVLRQISAIEDTKTVSGIQAQTIAVSLNLEGSYDGLKAFLNRVQIAPRLLDVTSVGFVSPATGIPSQFQFAIFLNAFSY